MVGREKEIKELNQRYSSGRAELVAVYGRRRVGKTYLIDQTFQGRITFRHAGLSPVEGKNQNGLQNQLREFYYSLVTQGMPEGKIPGDWMEAFFFLEMFLQKKDDGKRQLVFFDEVPWMDTKRSGFMTAFEGFWNNWGCHRPNLMVVVCGSANSWILDKLVNNHGGLYGRLTCEIKLEPFTLHECEEFFREAGVRLSRYDMVQSYMIVGGIPYYMSYFRPELSLAQNIDQLFFSGKGRLANEYDRLFSSVFSNPERMKKIVELLNTRSLGYTRKEISEKLGISNGGTLSQCLNALVSSDFVARYVPFGNSGREEHYKLTDPFCLFYLHFIKDKKINNENFWAAGQNSQAIISWRGIAFEHVCFNHIRQIKNALGISGVETIVSGWAVRKKEEKGTQIDLLIQRRDNVINMCELKFYRDKFHVDKDYYMTLLHRQELLREEVPKRMSIHSTLITTIGLDYNEYSGIFTNTITLDQLFGE